MWQRFTKRAISAYSFAEEEAIRSGHTDIAPEHLLLGLVRETNVASCLLGLAGVTPEQIRSEIKRQMPRGDGRFERKLQVKPQLQRALEKAFDESRQLFNGFVGTEHLLLALIQDEGLAGKTLAALGISLEQMRREVMALQESLCNPPPPKLCTPTSAEIFAAELDRLPAEQREALTGIGLAFIRLPVTMQRAIASLVKAEINGGIFVLNNNALMRVNIARTEGALHIAVTGSASFLVNFVSKDMSD